uniref:CST complex subunit STN1 n=1 Tax=Oryza rufipogon TaxID=4529 RepID=A0A0E0NVH6_ORYRU
MDSLHLVHVKLLAADLLSLASRHTSPPSFARCGRTVTRAEIVGVVVSRDRREKFLRFLVDDGTGCVPCVLWLNHHYLNAASSSSRASDSDPTAEMALRMSEVVSLGTLLRVRGRIVLYRGAIQIAVRDVVLEKDPNVEDQAELGEEKIWATALSASKNWARYGKSLGPNEGTRGIYQYTLDLSFFPDCIARIYARGQKIRSENSSGLHDGIHIWTEVLALKL